MMRSLASIRSSVALIGLFSFAVVTVFASGSGGGNVFTDPSNFSRWEVIGPSGGDVRSIVVDPRNKDRLYVSTLDGQIHVSADGGRSWRLLANLNRPQMVVDDLLVDRVHSNILYASGHRHQAAGGFFKSADYGQTWREAPELRNEAIHAMAQSPDQPDHLFVGTTKGVWVSRDSGDSWTKIESDSMPINVNSMAVDPRDTNILYAGTWWRAYKSTDAGRNWSLVANGMIDDSDVFAITVNPRNTSHVIASACSGIYESFNGGDRWNKIQGIPSTSRRTRDIMQHPTRPDTYFAATTEGFWMSVNAGRSWSMTTQRNLEINAIAVHPESPDRVYIATNIHGIMISEDGGRSFSQSNESFTSRLAYTITPDRDQPGRFYATTRNTASSGGFVFVTNDAGRTWTPGRNLDMNRVAPYALLQDRANPNVLYIGTNHGLYSSNDRGNSWSHIPVPRQPVRRVTGRTAAQRRASAAAIEAEMAKLETSPPALSGTVRVLAKTEDDKNGILAGTDTGLYRTYDISKGWQKLEFGEGMNENVFAVHSSPLVPGTIWVGTATSGVLVSRDDGETWTKTEATPDGIPVSAIVSDPTRPNYLYVGTTQSLYFSRDGGRSWARVRGTLPLGNFASILIDPDNPDELLIASAHQNDGGLFHSDDAGIRWRRIDTEDMKIPSRRVWAMVFDPSDPSRIYAASHSSGIYRIERQRESASRPRVATSEAGN